ncbi:MAG: class I SAM-dependent methyltransferase [Solirubrobacteraceae bacterium]
MPRANAAAPLGSLEVSGYVYEQSFEHERARLAGMEAQWDPGTFRHIEALGLPASASCWEIGAGAGSVAAWLAKRSGRLLITDLDTRFVDHLGGGHVTVQRHDIAADAPPAEHFDLIHARLLLEHLPARETILDRLIESLHPGGWLVVEDYDWTSYGSVPVSQTGKRVTDAVLDFMTQAGFDPLFGRRLLRELRARGLNDTVAEGRTLMMPAGHPGGAFYRLSLLALREQLVARGAISDRDVEAVLAEMEEPDRVLVSPAMVAGWGRRA